MSKRKKPRALPEPPILAERSASWLHRFASFLEKSPVIRIAGLSGITALVLLGYWAWTAPERRQEQRLRYFEVIQSRTAKGPSRAVKEALEGLVADHDTLEKLNLSGAWLYRARLRGALLPYASLDSSLLDSADLRRAVLSEAHILHASLNGARFDDATMERADLSESRAYNPSMQRVWLRRGRLRRVSFEYALMDSAEMFAVQMDSASLVNSDLHNAALGAANLRSTDLSGTEFSGTRLAGADLRQAKLKDIKNWRGIRCLEGANLFGVRDAPAGFIEWALGTMGAISVESDSLWKRARHALLRRATSSNTVASGTIVGSGIAIQMRSRESYRTPVSLNDTADAFAWFTIKDGKPERLMFVIPADTIADCLTLQS